MTIFDLDGAERARQDNPGLTPYDTGEMLEPHVWPTGSGEWGKVDFDNSESGTDLTVYAYPSSVEDDTIVLEIDSSLLQKLRIIVNDGDVARIAHDGTPTYGERDGS